MDNVSHNASLASHEQCDQTQATSMVMLSEIFTLLVGLPVFSKLLWMMVKSRKMTDILKVNLALFHSFHYLLCVCHLFLLQWLPNFQNKFIRMVLVYVLVGGPMSLCFITLERYVAVIHPASYALLKTQRVREICSAVVWLSSLATPLAIFVPKYTNPSIKLVLKTIPVVVIAMVIEIILTCTISILRALKKSGPGKDKLHPVKKKAFVTMCTTTAITMFCYIPVVLQQRFHSLIGMPAQCLFISVNMLLLSAASVAHTLFYLHSQGELRFCRTCRRKGP